MVSNERHDHRHFEEPDLTPNPSCQGGSCAGDVTQILSAIKGGDGQAAEQLLPLVYEELRKLAADKVARERPGQTLQATALVHEAYLRLVDVEKVQHWDSRGHFFSAAAEAMRRILVEQARRRNARKRGAGRKRLEIGKIDPPIPQRDDHLLALDEALAKLAAMDSQRADVVKLRYFAGLTINQVAEVLGLSSSTVDNYWAYARAWLRVELSDHF